MLPKKLFTPKCLLPDRDEAFKDDLSNFFNYIRNNILPEKEIISYQEYKKFYKEKKISMLHFSKRKEESSKEYYEVLFGEVQNFFFKEGTLSQIFSIYTLYSLYYTQTTNTFYQINTILEFLLGVNKLMLKFINSNEQNTKNIGTTIFQMIKKLKNDDAFSIGVIPGLKSIILNKYGIPIENKENVYSYTKEINEHINELKKNNNKNEKSEIDSKIIDNVQKNNQILFDYNNIKKNIICDIKDLNMDQDDYVNFINNNYKEQDLFMEKNIIEQGKEFLKKEDLAKDEITQLDFLFNKII